MGVSSWLGFFPPLLPPRLNPKPETLAEDYCGRTEPEIGPNGSLTGRWAECLAWAVVFEHQDDRVVAS